MNIHRCNNEGTKVREGGYGLQDNTERETEKEVSTREIPTRPQGIRKF